MTEGADASDPEAWQADRFEEAAERERGLYRIKEGPKWGDVLAVRAADTGRGWGCKPCPEKRRKAQAQRKKMKKHRKRGR